MALGQAVSKKRPKSPKLDIPFIILIFQDRLWRKTVSDHGSIFGCKGVDGNRNWDFHFGGNERKMAGTSGKCW
jgi:hypothetical protein